MTAFRMSRFVVWVMCRVLTTCAVTIVISCRSSVKVMHSAQLLVSVPVLGSISRPSIRCTYTLRLRALKAKSESTFLSNAARFPKQHCFLGGSGAFARLCFWKEQWLDEDICAVPTLSLRLNSGSILWFILVEWINLLCNWLFIHVPNKCAVSSACLHCNFA
jgi:hypothetical protein